MTAALQHRPAGTPESINPFVVGPAVLASGGEGPLSGKSFAVKDLFDVAGIRTGCGNPQRLEDAVEASAHADAVEALLDAGCVLLGKTVTDELAFSLSGTNVHYGTPENPAAPGRVPGGSSSGSVSAVASGLVDLALGTDTGGSTRVPASYCGVYGLRTTHARISRRGVMLLAPSFCAVGLFASTAELLELGWDALQLGAEVVPPLAPSRKPTSLVVAPELFDLADPHAAAVLLDAAHHLAEKIEIPIEERRLVGAGGLVDLRNAFRAIQLEEAWQVHGAWIESRQPKLGPGVASRFQAASEVHHAEVEIARVRRAAFRSALTAFLGKGAFLLQPAASGAAPPIDLDGAEKDDLRTRTLTLTAPAGLAGSPVLSMPLGEIDGLPIGLAAVGLPGDDSSLVTLACERAD